jgi:hypothetical protein
MLQTGVISNARDPARDAWLYNPRAASGSRFRTLAASGINRYYHSIALLLPDASIMVAGCEYGEWQPADRNLGHGQHANCCSFELLLTSCDILDTCTAAFLCVLLRTPSSIMTVHWLQ